MAGNSGMVERSGHGRDGWPDTAVSGAEAVLRLAEGLPTLADVREVGEHDRSDLTRAEQQQLQQTEEVISAALAAGDAALWVIAQALERTARGRWWRATHPSLAAYVGDRVGRSAVYVRQLRMNAPLALETARRTGTVPKPSQMVVTRKTEQLYGLDAAVTLYEVVRDVIAELGGQPTAKGLEAVHVSLPERLPDQSEARRAVIEQAARHALAPRPSTAGSDREPRPVPRMAGHWQIRPRPVGAADAPIFEQESNDSARIQALRFEANSNEGVSSAARATGSASAVQADTGQNATARRYLGILEEALAALAAVDQSLTSDVYARAAADPAQAPEYERIRQHLIIRAAAIRAKALRAPTI